MKQHKVGLVMVFLLGGILLVRGSDLNKSFKYLTAGDYPNAFKFLKEVIAEDPLNAAGNYGMAKYYFAKDNPAHQLDSANRYIKRAMQKVPLPDTKDTKRFLAVGVRDFTIQNLAKDINNEAFNRAEKENSVAAYQFFIDHYSEQGLLNRATAARNQLAFIKARAANNPADLKEFMQQYPQAQEVGEARELYEKLLYEQTTKDGSYQSYKKYLEEYPKGKFAAEAQKNYNQKLLEHYNREHDLKGYAEFLALYKQHPAYAAVQDSVYALATRPGTVVAFDDFVRRFPDNPHIDEGWQQLYQLFTAAATDSVYQLFLQTYPQFANKKQVEADRALAKMDLKPFQQGGKWGYAYKATKDSLVVPIRGEYEEVFDFHCGLAAVRIKPCSDKCTYFYINKNNRRAIAADYNFAGDFHEGFAIVGIGDCEGDGTCRYGIIDVRGRYVVPPMYEDIEAPSDGLYLVSQNDKFGYINQQGKTVISLKYSDALSFQQGVAGVALGDNWFFIDREGRQQFIAHFHDVSSFSDSLCAVTADGDNWGYIDLTGNFVIEAQYEDAGDFENGVAIVSRKIKDPKVKGAFISQRYKIDKTGKVLEKMTAAGSKKNAKKRHGRR